MQELTPDIVADLKTKHGPHLTAIRARKQTLVFRKPTRGEYDRWRDQTIADKSQQSRFDRELAKACIVWPSEDAFSEALEDQPAMLGIEVVGALTSLAGLTDEISVEKL